MATDANTETCQGVEDEEGSLREEALDIFHLRRFTLGDRRLELEILTLFIEQAPVTIAALQGARSDYEWINAGHTLKGSARAVGAWRLAKLAEKAELLGGISDRAACERVVAKLDRAASEARARILALDRSDASERT